MIAGKLRKSPRKGSTAPEVALLLAVFLMFLFGVFEYSRYLLILQTASNAARDTARYAVVNVNNTSFGTQSTVTASRLSYTGSVLAPAYSSGAPAFQIDTLTTQARNDMGGMDPQIGNFQVDVYPCDSTQMYQQPPVLAPKTQGGTQSWNAAQFGELIAVRITGQYTVFLPTLMFLNNKIDINVIAAMSSEG